MNLPTIQYRRYIRFSLPYICLIVIGCFWGCKSDGEDPKTPLSAIQWDSLSASVFLNDEYVADASVRFSDLSESDSTTIIISGINPTENIQIGVATTRNDDGDILFSGNHLIEGISIIKVDGVYRPRLTNVVIHTPVVQVNVSYRVIDRIASQTYSVPFEENSALIYHHTTHAETYSEADSLKFLCSRINGEIAKHLKSITFRFEQDGRMFFKSTTTNNQDIEQSFRYWVSKQGMTDDNIIHIEEPSRFFECIINSLIPSTNRILGTFPYQAKESTATLFIPRFEISEFFNSIVLIGDLHQKIYSYLYNFLLTEGSWTDKDKSCFLLMTKQTKYFSQVYDPTFFYYYVWAFSTINH